MKKEIHMKLESVEEAMHPLNDAILSEIVASYLEKESRFVTTSQITLVIHGLSSKKEKQQLEELLRNYYQEKMEEIKTIDRFDDLKRIILFLIGVLLILLSSMLTSVLSEVILVAGWVAIWETVYDLFFLETKRKREYFLAKRLATASICFSN